MLGVSAAVAISWPATYADEIRDFSEIEVAKFQYEDRFLKRVRQAVDQKKHCWRIRPPRYARMTTRWSRLREVHCATAA